ncbi:MAG: hypothetical protein ABL903_08170 [Methylococcales bacterium]
MRTEELIAEAVLLPVEEKARIVDSLLKSIVSPEFNEVISLFNEQLEKLNNEVLRKIGRNVMLFQQIEFMLKFLITHGKQSGYVAELNQNREQQAKTLHKKTMGHLVGKFLENSFSSTEESNSEPEEITEGWCAFSFMIECDDSFYEERAKALTMLVNERNELIHHLHPKWDRNSFASGKEIENYLDQLREKILPEFEFFKAQINTLKHASDILSSHELEKQIELAWLRQSDLVKRLLMIAEQNARLDGWSVLSTAAQVIHQQAPQELVDLNKYYGYKTLKAVILATEFFDVFEEQTNKGGIRVLYRIKAGLDFPY